MAENRGLYEQVILDHNKRPRNYGKLDDANFAAEGYNPLCGDHFHIYLKVEDDRIADIHFEGAGCAISKSSASVMTTLLKGKTKEEAQALFKQFQRLVTLDRELNADKDEYGKMIVFSGVREYPVRIKCATLAWHTMLSALQGEEETVKTE